MKMTKVASSNINAIGYSEAFKQLHVEFKGGKTFAYTDVSKEEFAALTAAPSTGKHFIQNIKSVKECCEAVKDWQEDLIAKLQADNELLREALELVRPETYYNQDGEEIDAGGHFVFMDNGSVDNEAMQKIHEALEATKDGE